MNVKPVVAAIGRGLYVAAAALGGLGALLVLILFATGTVTWKGLAEAARALRGRPGPPAPASGPQPGLEDAWKEVEAARARQEETLRQRRVELQSLEDRVRLELARLERERQEAARREAAARERTAAAQAAAAAADAEVAANSPIFSRMEGAALLSLMKDWENARIVRYLRAMRPSKAAEVLEAMVGDPQLAARAPLLMEEFRK